MDPPRPISTAGAPRKGGAAIWTSPQVHKKIPQFFDNLSFLFKNTFQNPKCQCTINDSDVACACLGAQGAGEVGKGLVGDPRPDAMFDTICDPTPCSMFHARLPDPAVQRALANVTSPPAHPTTWCYQQLPYRFHVTRRGFYTSIQQYL